MSEQNESFHAFASFADMVKNRKLEQALAAEQAAHEATREEKDRLKALLDEGWKDGTALIARQSTEIERLRGVNLDRLLRIETALHFSEAIRRKDAVVIVGEMIYALRDADRDELIEWKRERAALAAGKGDGDV